MSAETQKHRPCEPIHDWTFTDQEMHELLLSLNLTPWQGSPLCNLESTGNGSAPRTSSKPSPELGLVLKVLTHPDKVFGLVYCPPFEPVIIWLYGSGKQDLAAHILGDDGTHQILWPISRETLLDALAASLALDQPAIPEGFTLSLDRGGFETLAAIVDLLQEGEILNTLERTPSSAIPINPDGLLDCYRRSAVDSSLRWMASRARLISPLKLDPTLKSLTQGLELLAAQGMLQRSAQGYIPVDGFNTACALMGACTGFCTVTAHWRQNKTSREASWDSRHLSALRTTGSLWLLEFSKVSSQDFSLNLGDVSSGILGEILVSLFQERPKAAVHTKTCPHCGSGLKPSETFCSACGAKIEKIEAVQEAQQPAPPAMESRESPIPVSASAPENARIRCPGCGAQIPPGNRFCINCGQKLAPARKGEKVGEGGFCTQCGAGLKPGTKFCSGCGVKV